MRGILIQLNARISKQRNQQIDELLMSIKTKEELNKTSHDPSTSTSLATNRNKLRTLLLYKYDLNLQKTKAKFYSMSNKANALLTKMIKQRHLKDKISSVHHPTTHTLTTNPREIANAFATYYQQLYNLKNDPDTIQPTLTSIQQFLHTTKLPQLSPSQLDAISTPISITEIENITKTLPLNKSPGNYGYTNEFIQIFCPKSSTIPIQTL
ncbi:unnamed protein product [Staurois parvus]|uniref:Uncharacterized protein n=1 Tax=Staurois parvus TaxID=386267 RepID=A0ABN9G7B8_9NEOB|nr:unnamed protein product [Staurois parvus]